jgi:hypothetical protein
MNEYYSYNLCNVIVLQWDVFSFVNFKKIHALLTFIYPFFRAEEKATPHG